MARKRVTWSIRPARATLWLPTTAAGALIANYNYGLGLISQTGPSGTGYYDFDGSGNTVGITGSSGTYVNQYSCCLLFGETSTISAALQNSFMFQGQSGIMTVSATTRVWTVCAHATILSRRASLPRMIRWGS